MIRISQIKLEVDQWEGAMAGSISFKNKEMELLNRAACRALGIKGEELNACVIVKKSLDARKKNEIKYIYTLDVEAAQEERILKRTSNAGISKAENIRYQYRPRGSKKLEHRPVIVGSGPGGIFCALMLAEQGYCPIVLERGGSMEERIKAVEHFWKTGELDPQCNVQFGEGGAGTFSDGKLNTMVKDKSGRNRKVLKTFVQYGGAEDILYLQKPHIGTDRLREVVAAMRERILSLGGDIRFHHKLTDIRVCKGKLTGIVINEKEELPCSVLVLAAGHSARDTFSMLLKRGLAMKQKPFAMGIRMEHPQERINISQYGRTENSLPAADYKLTHQTAGGRAVYSFCMCPGGFVVNASSELGHLAVNGMSNYRRDEKNANSAIIVSVTPEDFEGDSPLAGVEFQRKWEALAYEAAGGAIPVETFGDFKKKQKKAAWPSELLPNMKGKYGPADLRTCLPDYVSEALTEAICAFDKKIKGFADENAVLSGVETRTSSPVRMERTEQLESNIEGIYPCGEGAGYAGGITSAAMDGIKVYEAIGAKYAPMKERGIK